MDKDCLKIDGRTDNHEHEFQTEKEGCIEALGAEVPIRRSSRLQSTKKVSYYLQDNSSKNSKKSLKHIPDRENSISEENKKHQLLHGNEDNPKKSSAAYKYHVGAKDGIRLVVDLNLKRSDWLTSMEKAVCVCQNHQNPGFQSFRQEVECLGDKNKVKIAPPYKTTASDASMNSYVQNKFLLSREIGKTFLDVSSPKVSTRDAPGEPSSFLGITLSGSKGRSKSSEVVHVNCDNTSVQENYSPNAECPGNVAFSSEEIKGSSCSRTGKVYCENLLSSTIEMNQESGGGNCRRSSVENRERMNSGEGMEVSGRDENAVVINDGLKRRKHNEKSNYMHHERILRSTKVFGGQILERRGLFMRRSSRLLSK